VTIGTALVIIAILYLIDKYHLWKKTAVACLVVLAVAVVGFTGYYGWQKLQEHRAEKAEQEKESKAGKDEGINLSAGLVPNWTIPPAPKGFISEDVAYAILHPVKANDTARTEGWLWYRDSFCAIVGDSARSVNRIIHDHDLFSLDSYDAKWLTGTNLPQEVKHALWSAKVAECRLPAGSKNVKACLDRERGFVTDDKFADLGSLIACDPKQEMVYLNSKTEGKPQ
jgi:hypothetical protein